MGLHQTEKFCTAKETINKTKSQPTEWNKIFTSDTSDKRLLYKIKKEFKPRQTNNTIKIGQRS